MDTLSERSIPIPFQRRCALSTSIDLSFVKQFEREVHEAYQRQGSLLRATVRSKNNVKGASTTFQKIGKGVASTQARHGKEIGRASCRERVCQYVSISGVAVSLKKKT